MKDISIIIPAWNEAKNLPNRLLEIKNVMKDTPLDYEIIVVNDGSTDDTSEICTKMVSDDRVKVVGYDKNMGKGFALKHGFTYCEGETVAFVDADSDIPFNCIRSFLTALKENGSDVVIGSKYLPNSKFESPLGRKILSRAYNFLVRLLLKVKVSDTQVGFKVFKRRVLEDVFSRILVKRFAFDAELLTVAQMRGYSISEVPVEVNHDGRVKSVNALEILKMLRDTLAVFFRRYIVRYYDRKP